MKIVVLALISLISTISLAWTLDTQLDFSTGKYTEKVTLYCSPGEALCFNTCGNVDTCSRKQKLCFNCLGSGQPLLRILFTEVDRLYQRSSQVLNSDQVSKVFNGPSLFVGTKSLFNFYTPVDSPDIENRFKSLCPSTSFDAVFVLNLKADQPAEIKYLICKNKVYESEVYVVEFLPPKIRIP